MFKKKEISIKKRRLIVEDNEATEEAGSLLRASQPAIVARGAAVQSRICEEKSDEAEVSEPQPGGVFEYGASDTVVVNDPARIFTHLEVDTDETQDSRAILERNVRIGVGILEGELERGVYRGQGAYAPVLALHGATGDLKVGPDGGTFGSINLAKLSGGFYGPLRGNKIARTTMRIDYNPEICKDYKETGYCGYGDTCKYLHDRSDYKAGWQIDKEYQQAMKARQAKMLERLQKPGSTKDGDGEDSSSSDDDEEVPFSCLFCRKKWAEVARPVVTICKHYFCEDCAMKQYAKTSKCSACQNDTNGTFNDASAVVDKLSRQKSES